MGWVMAKNLANHRAAHVHASPPILVWNRTSAKADSLFEELGQHKVRVAQTLEQVVTECDVIFTALANDETVKSIYQQFVQTLKVGYSAAMTLALLIVFSTRPPRGTKSSSRRARLVHFI
jgi:3-hydroxyisobutyrate dehydrogenase-like beta-hydroxyacid dehydrogenase